MRISPNRDKVIQVKIMHSWITINNWVEFSSKYISDWWNKDSWWYRNQTFPWFSLNFLMKIRVCLCWTDLLLVMRVSTFRLRCITSFPAHRGFDLFTEVIINCHTSYGKYNWSIHWLNVKSIKQFCIVNYLHISALIQFNSTVVQKFAHPIKESNLYQEDILLLVLYYR